MSDLNLYEESLAIDLVLAESRIKELEAENKLLNEQLAAIEEMGTESLNALPDCLMKLAPALVENDELKTKLKKVIVFLDNLYDYQSYDTSDLIELLNELEGVERQTNE